MIIFPVLATFSALVVAYALVSGFSAPVADGELQHVNSAQWMFRRVAFQTITVAAVLFALVLLA